MEEKREYGGIIHWTVYTRREYVSDENILPSLLPEICILYMCVKRLRLSCAIVLIWLQQAEKSSILFLYRVYFPIQKKSLQ